MNINKSILVGILFIIIAGVLFISNILNPIVHPITYLFLMGSSKGKDIIFFGLMGFFLISTQIFKDLKVDSDKFLKITLVLGSITLTLGILLEVLFRYQMGIGLNTIFMTIGKSISSTSILHTHLLKSVFGNFITNLIGPFIGKEINTGIGLYQYIPEVGKYIANSFPGNQKQKICPNITAFIFRMLPVDWSFRWRIILNTRNYRNMWSIFNFKKRNLHRTDCRLYPKH